MQAFATTTELMPHQQAAVEKVAPIRVGALFMEMGTGKSRTAIELVRRRHKKIDKVVWFCPVSLKETVRQEILKHTDCSDIYVFNDRTEAERIPDVRWYVVGIESMSSSSRVLIAVNTLITDKTMVILDESSYIKGPYTNRTVRITQLSQIAKYRLVLTGTPMSQGVVDLYAQMKFLSPNILGYNSFYSFAANHLEYSEKYPGRIVRSHNIGYLAAKIAPYTYQVTKEECLTLPKKLYEKRYFSLTREQSQYYELAKDEILGELLMEDREMSSVIIFKLFTALQEIASGFWNRNGRTIEMDEDRTFTLLCAVEDIPENEKIVIFAKFQHDIQEIKRELENIYGLGCAAIFTGEQSERERNRQLELFRKEKRFFLATQSSGGHGLTLNEAHYVIFFNNGFKYAERLQAEDRCHRIGQGYPVTYIDIECCCGIDERIASALARKGNAVTEFKSELDKVKDKKTKIRELIKSL